MAHVPANSTLLADRKPLRWRAEQEPSQQQPMVPQQTQEHLAQVQLRNHHPHQVGFAGLGLRASAGDSSLLLAKIWHSHVASFNICTAKRPYYDADCGGERSKCRISAGPPSCIRTELSTSLLELMLLRSACQCMHCQTCNHCNRLWAPSTMTLLPFQVLKLWSPMQINRSHCQMTRRQCLRAYLSSWCGSFRSCWVSVAAQNWRTVNAPQQ